MRTADQQGRLDGWLPWLAFFLAVVGARLLLIALYGTETPMRDEWFVLAQRLYGPLAHGQLGLADLLEPFNEHRLVTTRLFSLFMLWLDGGVWSPVQQMIASALVQGLALTGLVRLLARACPPPYQAGFYLLSLILCGLPLAVENVLIGFAVQYYLLILFSYLFLWALVASKPFSGPWLAGMACGLLSLLSMASGAFTLICGALFLGLRRLRLGGYRSDLPLALALLAGTGLAMALTPRAPADWWVAHSVGEFAFALLRILSWPGIGGCALVIYLPLTLFVWGQLRRPPAADDPSWFVFLMALWLGAHFLVFSYSRAHMPLASRYNDFFIMGLVINFLCAMRRDRQLAVAREALPEAQRSPPPYMPFSQLWILVVLAGTVYYCHFLIPELGKKLVWAPLPEQNVRSYLQTRDYSILAGKPYPDIPYDNPKALQGMLDDPAIVRLLPPNLVPANAGRQPGWLRQLVAHLEAGGLVLLAAGGLCLAAALARRPDPGPGPA